MPTTITAPATMGKTVEVTGEEYGPFLVHQSGDCALVGLRDVPTWRVTHTKTGNRIPFEFMAREAATRWATGAAAFHDWDAVKTGGAEIENPLKAQWLTGRPGKEALRQLNKLAAECGGVKS